MSSNDGNDDQSGAKRPLESGADEPGGAKKACGEFRFGVVDVDAPVVMPERQPSGGFTFGVVRSVTVEDSVASTRNPRVQVTTTCNMCRNLFTYIHAEGLPDKFTNFCENCRTLRESMVAARSVQAVAQPVQAVAEPVRAVQASAGSGSGGARQSQAEPDLGRCGHTPTMIYCNICGHENKLNGVNAAIIDRHCRVCKKYVNCTDDNCAACAKHMDAPPKATGNVIRTYTYKCFECKIRHRMERPAGYNGNEPYRPSTHGRQHCHACRQFTTCSDQRNCAMCKGDAGSSAANAEDNASGERGIQMRRYDCPKCGQKHFEAKNESNPVWRKFNAVDKKHCVECKDRVECTDAMCVVCVPVQSAAGVFAGVAQAGAGPVRVENGTPGYSDVSLFCTNCKKTIAKTGGAPKPGDDICNLCKTTGHVVRTYMYKCPNCKTAHIMEKPAKSKAEDPYKASYIGRPHCERCVKFSSCVDPSTCGCAKCQKLSSANFAINAALVAARAAQAGAGSASAVQAGAGGAQAGASGEKRFKALKFIQSIDQAAIGKWDITLPLEHGINTDIKRVPVYERRVLYRHDEYIHGLFDTLSATVSKVSKLEKTVADQAQKLEAQGKELEELRRIVEELRRKGDGGA